MAKKNGEAAVLPELRRKPFKDDGKVQAWKLCAKSAIRIDTLSAELKDERERFEKLKDAIRNGGYLEDGQGHLPLEERGQDEVTA